MQCLADTLCTAVQYSAAVLLRPVVRAVLPSGHPPCCEPARVHSCELKGWWRRETTTNADPPARVNSQSEELAVPCSSIDSYTALWRIPGASSALWRTFVVDRGLASLTPMPCTKISFKSSHRAKVTISRRTRAFARAPIMLLDSRRR